MVAVTAVGVAVAMVVAGLRLEIDLGRCPAKDALEPAAEECQAAQETTGAELPPEIRHAVPGSRLDLRPGQRGDDGEQHQRRPGAAGQYRPHLVPVDAAQPPDDVDDYQR